MTGESGQSDTRYEHAGGYKPTFDLEPMTARDYAWAVIPIVASLIGNALVDKLLGRHTPGHLFSLSLIVLVSIVLLVVGARRVIRAGRPGVEDSVPDPAVELRPARTDGDPVARRRRARNGGIVIIIFSLVCFVYALGSLVSALGGPR